MPPIVHEVLRSPGQPLDAETRAFMEPRFGADFSSVQVRLSAVPAHNLSIGRSDDPLEFAADAAAERAVGPKSSATPAAPANFGQVRIHRSPAATEAARVVTARAFTVGSHIVFGEAAYQPRSREGQRLLAHELAHVVQQQEIQSAPLQRAPCFSGGGCRIPIPGAPGPFGEKSTAEEEALKRASGAPPPPGAPAPCLTPRHKDPATNVSALVASMGTTLPTEVHGIFINACMPPSVGAANNLCRFFPDGAPAGAPPTKSCVQVHASDDDDAKAILAKPAASRTENDNKTVLNLVSTIVHESQHAHFDATAAAIVPAGPDCSLNTVLFHGPTPTPGGTDYDVEYYLSEMSAEIAEFAPFFQNAKSSPTKANQDALLHEELNIAEGKDESISGILWALKCKCACSTVDSFTAKVFNDATSAWPADQKEEFQKAMTRFIEYWPVALQKRPAW